MDAKQRITNVFRDFEKADIYLVEWETRLLLRLGYPLAIQDDYIFLVADQHLDQASAIAVTHGLRPVHNHDQPKPSYTCEHAKVGRRFMITTNPDYDNNNLRSCMLILLPLSWSGIPVEETLLVNEITPLNFSRPIEPNRLEIPLMFTRRLPSNLRTVPVHTACEAYVRILASSPQDGGLRHGLICELMAIIVHQFFDTTYEGDYMEIPSNDVPLSKKEISETDAAVMAVEGWHFRKDEEWIRKALINILCGRSSYESLPAINGSSDKK